MPESLRVQLHEDQWRRFLIDPVMAAKVLLGFEFDIFQQARLRLTWWTPFTIDSSGYSTGKTLCTWVHYALRAMLIPNQHIAVFYPTGETGRNSFWNYFDECQSDLFYSQLGRLASDEDEEGGQKMSRASACFKAYFLNGSRILLPAPGFARGAQSQASMRYNVVHLEEWTHVDADAIGNKKISGIDKQIIGRATRTLGCWNPRHPLWTNHIHFSAPAKPRQHPAWRRFRAALKAAEGIRNGTRVIGGGDPAQAVTSFCYKDWSRHKCHTGRSWREEYGHDDNVAQMRRNLANDAEFLGEVLGIWSVSGSGWYSGEALLVCVSLGRQHGLKPILSRSMDAEENLAEVLKRASATGQQMVFYFCGVDSAPAQRREADDGAIVVLRAMPKVLEGAWMAQALQPEDWQIADVYARKLRNASMREWSGRIHDLDRRFTFTTLMVDPGAGGGGGYLRKELAYTKQELNGVQFDVAGLATPDDVAAGPSARRVVQMFSRGDTMIRRLWGKDMGGDDVLLNNAHVGMRASLNNGVWLPAPANEWRREQFTGWDLERQMALRCLTEMTEQIGGISVLTNNEGEWELTARGVPKFIGAGRKDLAYARLYAHTAFLGWLRTMGQWDLGGGGDEDESASGDAI